MAPGDELLIVRLPADSSPPAGYDLQNWRTGQAKPVELGGGERVAELFDSNPILLCAILLAHRPDSLAWQLPASARSSTPAAFGREPISLAESM